MNELTPPPPQSFAVWLDSLSFSCPPNPLPPWVGPLIHRPIDHLCLAFNFFLSPYHLKLSVPLTFTALYCIIDIRSGYGYASVAPDKYLLCSVFVQSNRKQRIEQVTFQNVSYIYSCVCVVQTVWVMQISNDEKVLNNVDSRHTEWNIRKNRTFLIKDLHIFAIQVPFHFKVLILEINSLLTSVGMEL